LSWRATAHVKPLTHHGDGTPLSAREKLILFVIADYHNEDYNCAWMSVTKAARASLTSERRFRELLQRLEKRKTLEIERREGRTNRYFFPGLTPPQFSQGSKKHPCNPRIPPLLQLPHPTPATATASEPLSNLKESEPSPPAADISISERVRKAEERSRLNREIEKAWYEALYEDALRKESIA